MACEVGVRCERTQGMLTESGQYKVELTVSVSAQWTASEQPNQLHEPRES